MNPYPFDRLKDVPVMIAVGTADSAAIIDGCHAFVAELKKLGIKHDFIVVEGATHHSIVYEAVERAFDFMGQAQKPNRSSN